MAESTMAQILNPRESGNRFTFELRNVPASFANALRRILLTGIPTVVLKDVQILENSSQLPHEMLRHRVEQLPLQVKSTESRIISETKVELRVPALEEFQEITTKHFTIRGDRKDILMKDEDGHDLLFLRLQPKEGVHLTAKLGVESSGDSQVSTVSYGFHIDADRAKEMLDALLASVPEPERPAKTREFENHMIQRAFHQDEKGQADWFDFFVESWGVYSPKELVRQSLALFKDRLQSWAKTPIRREGDLNVVQSQSETHTIGAVVQRVLVDQGRCARAYYDVPHPLLADMRVGFETSEAAEEVLQSAVQTIVGWCDALDAQLSA